MNSEKHYNVSIQQIEIFMKAVELSNFTQVANAFNYTPSMISKTIAAMEEELGLQLFIRKPHELTPTPAARMLAGDLRHFVRSFQNSVSRAKQYEQEMNERIVLGFVDSSDEVDHIIYHAIHDFSEEYPNIRIIAEKHDMHRAMELINCGMLDMAITNEMELPYLETHNLPWKKLCDTNIAIYIPSGNTLFQKPGITWEDLRETELVSLDPLMHPSYADWLSDLCSAHGFVPRITSTYRTVRSLMFSLKLNQAVFIGNSMTSDWRDDELRQVVLPERSFSLIAWRENIGIGSERFRDYLVHVYQERFKENH